MSRQAIDKILDALKNGKHHTIEDITEKTGIKGPKIGIIIAFLEEFQFIKVDKDQKITLNALTKQFLDRLDKTDPAPFYEKITA
jgi:hypothetical protein